MDDQRVGKLADGSQNTTALDEHSKATNESFRASVTTREKRLMLTMMMFLMLIIMLLMMMMVDIRSCLLTSLIKL